MTEDPSKPVSIKPATLGCEPGSAAADIVLSDALSHSATELCYDSEVDAQFLIINLNHGSLQTKTSNRECAWTYKNDCEIVESMKLKLVPAVGIMSVKSCTCIYQCLPVRLICCIRLKATPLSRCSMTWRAYVTRHISNVSFNRSKFVDKYSPASAMAEDARDWDAWKTQWNYFSW